MAVRDEVANEFTERRRRALPASRAVIIRPGGALSLQLREMWEYRELLYFLIWRDVKVRYKQTVIGGLWAVLQPVLAMVVFTLIFGRFAKVGSDGLPYPIFAYSALLPWNLFSSALIQSTNSIVGQAGLISKVYFPRLILPISVALSGIVDFALGFVVLLGLMVWFSTKPTLGLLALPLFTVLALGTALSVGFWLSALNVRYRDIRHAVPFVAQIWFFASPVIYPIRLIPEAWRGLYALNPMVGVIEGFRWALLGKEAPDFGVVAVSAAVVVVSLAVSILYFNRASRSFVDVL